VLVGRESELSLLAERIAERRAFAVLGEAGVGKTALVRAAAERTGKRLYEAGALATLSWLPYLSLRRASVVSLRRATHR
jgi:MoxR-like ATPase